MAEPKRHGVDPDKWEEARDLAREAAEQRKGGNREEADFLADEARALDKAAADEVLGSGRKPAA